MAVAALIQIKIFREGCYNDFHSNGTDYGDHFWKNIPIPGGDKLFKCLVLA